MLVALILICFIIYIVNTNNQIQKYRDEIKKLKDKIKNLEDEILVNTSQIKNDSILFENNIQNNVEIYNSNQKNNINEVNNIKQENTYNGVDNFKLQKNNDEIKSIVAELKSSNEEFSKDKANIKLSDEEKNKYNENTIINKEESRINDSIKNIERVEKDNKNTLILTTGAILIVLSAIVFLMSTWYVVPNILKTGVLFLLVGVFLGISKIAKDKFKLPKTSDTFFYIAMAYIPVCLLSISIFELFGKYFSINGEGKNIYLTFSFVITSFIYYLTYRIKNSRNILYGSILSQVLSVILFSLIFSEDILLICINLLLYNILLIVLTKESKVINDESFYVVIPLISVLVSLGNLFTNSGYEVILIILLAINFLILELKYNNSYYSYLFNIFLNLFGIYFVFGYKVDFLESDRILYSTLYIGLIFFIENLLLIKSERVNFKKSCTIVVLCSLEIINLFNIFYQNTFIQTYIISILQLLILLYTYIKTDILNKNVCSAFISILFILTGIDIIIKLDLPNYFYMIFAIVVFIISNIINKQKYEELYKISFIISHINILITYLTCSYTLNFDYLLNIFYIIVLMVVYSYSYIKYREKEYFKLLTYFLSNILLLAIFNKINISTNIKYCIPTITTFLISIIEYILNKNENRNSLIYIIISEIVSFIYLSFIGTEFGAIISIAFSTYLLIYNYNSNYKDDIINIIPLLGVIPSLFLYDINELFMLIMSATCFVPITVLSIINKKINLYTIFSGIYLLLVIFKIDTNTYFNEILLILWSFIHIIFFEDKEKDLFKVIGSFCLLILYNSLSNDLELTELTLFNYLGVILFVIYLYRIILKKYIKELDTIEAITFIIIYLSAISAYNDEIDGILFVLLIVGLVILSYIKKYGSIFFVSIGAILVNVFLLTREFWFSIPWWVYLLGIGTILIVFAIRNEAREEKVNLETIIKKIKDKVE